MPTAASPVLSLARGGDIDGQQRQVLYLADGLARDDVTVALDGDGGLHDELLRRGIDSRVARMSPWRSISHVIDRHVDAYRLLSFARSKRIRLVHAHDVWKAEYGRFIARRLAVPYVVHVRGPLTARDIRKHRLGLADAVIAIAQRYVDDLTRAGTDPARIALIDDAVDLDLFDPAQADPKYIQRNFGIDAPLLVGIVGRLSNFKRTREFLDIVRRLDPAVAHSAVFVIAGEWESAEYRQQIDAEVRQAGLEGRVRFIGRCPHDQVPKLLSSLDLLVTLSGGSIMFEAMAMGKAVLSIRTDGRHSQHTRHGTTAWCIDGDDAGAAAAGLTRLLTDEGLRTTLARAGRPWVEQNLSKQAMVRKVDALYARLAPKA